MFHLWYYCDHSYQGQFSLVQYIDVSTGEAVPTNRHINLELRMIILKIDIVDEVVYIQTKVQLHRFNWSIYVFYYPGPPTAATEAGTKPEARWGHAPHGDFLNILSNLWILVLNLSTISYMAPSNLFNRKLAPLIFQSWFRPCTEVIAICILSLCSDSYIFLCQLRYHWDHRIHASFHACWAIVTIIFIYVL